MGSGHQLLYRPVVKQLIACLTAGLLASGCEQMQPMLAQAGYTHDLGEFEVEQIGFVREMPGPGDGFDGGGYLKLELASAHQLPVGYPTYWIGVASDYCPLDDDHKLISFGEFDNGAGGFRYPSRGQPIEKSEDGAYRYTIYVVRAYPPPGKTHDDYGTPQSGPNARSEYDIIIDENDLCLQVFGGDHYNVFARSSVISVKHEAIRAAAIEARIIEAP